MRIQRMAACTVAILAAAAATLIAPAVQAQRVSDCDRRCLLAFLTEYTEALTDNNVERLAVAPTVRVTSNGAVTELGKGAVWGKDRRLSYRQTFVDPLLGAAVFYGVVTNAGASRAGAGASAAEHSWYYVARLRIEQKRVTEIEEVAYEWPKGGFGADPATLSLPDRIFDTWLPQSERVSRAELFEIAGKYFDAISHRIDYHDVPWHPECQRIELGMFTVNSASMPGSCGGEFQTPSLKFNVENRRVYVADVERGVVLAAATFLAPPDYPNNGSSVVFEVFKVQDGMIRHIHAFFRPGQPVSGWGEGPGS